jgi:signal transduction histidine kinase
MTAYIHPKYWAVAVLSLAQFLALVTASTIIFGALALLDTGGLIFGVGMLAFGLVGAVIIAKVPGNRIGWVFAFVGIFGPFSSFQQIAVGLAESHIAIKQIAVGQLLADAAWSGFFVCLIVLIPLWYPSGRAINRYVGLAAPVAVTGWILGILSAISKPTVRILLDDTITTDDAWLRIPNPLAHWPVPDTAFFDVGAALFIIPAGLVALVSMVVRTVRSRGDERLQMKWLLFPQALFLGFILFAGLFESQLDSLTRAWQVVLTLVIGALILSVPISVGVAITKYKLYDINVVISKTVTYGFLAVFITGVYAVVVVGIGSLVGSGGEQNLALSIVAVAIVAVAFEPLRNRLQRWANRIVFGERSTPYEVLSRTTAQLAGTGSPDEALEQVTQLVVDGTGAADAVLWLKVGESLHPTAATPATALTGLAEVPLVDDHMPVLVGDTSTPVRHRGEMLGALSITKPPGESVTGIDEKMLHDVASGTALLLRNIGLNAELVARAEQLRLSRRRLVAAHDAERHRLERDLHDGAQQQVVAIKVKLGIARTLAEREGAPTVESLVSSLAVDTQQAVDAMREVAHGIYPPLLEAEGLGVALNAASRNSPIPIDLDSSNVGRYERPVEESVYFCILETVARAINGGATRAHIQLTANNDSVQFTVRHDGDIQDLLAVSDRIDAFGGRLTADVEGSDDVVTGHLPSGDLLAVSV